MVSPDLINAFDDCVERLRKGQSVDDCLRLYPHYAAALRPMLETGLAVRRAAPVIPAEARARVRARVMQAAAQNLRRASGWSTRLTLLAASLMVLLFAAVFVVYFRQDDSDHLHTEPIPASETATSMPAATLTAAITPTLSATAAMSLSLTPVPTISETVTPSPTATRALTLECRFVVTASSANLREGPGTGYSALGFAFAGDDFPVTAIHASETWVEVSTPDGERWIATSTGELRGDCSNMPVSDIPMRADNGTSTPTPGVGDPGSTFPDSPGSTPSGAKDESNDDNDESEDD